MKARWCSNAASAYSFRDLVWSRSAMVCALARAGGRGRDRDASKGLALVGRNNYRLDPDLIGRDWAMTFSTREHRTLLLRKRECTAEPNEASPGYSATPHEPSRALLEEDHLLPAARA